MVIKTWPLCLDLRQLVAQRVKHLPAVWETQVQSLGWEDPLEKEMATHSSTLAWKIPWTEELQFSRSAVSDSLRPRELQHARPPCPSPTPQDRVNYNAKRHSIFAVEVTKKYRAMNMPALTHCQVWQTSLPCVMGPRMQNTWCDRFKIRVT